MAFSATYSPTAPTGRTGQGSGINNREDLDDKLTMLAATTCPMTLLCKRGKAKSTLSEWPVDKLAAPNTGGVVEGSDANNFEDPFADAARLQNRAQRLWRQWMVTVEQEATESAGPQDVARAKVKKMLELKRDIEATILSANDAVTPSAGVAGKMRGFGKWINNASPGAEVPADYVTPSGHVLGAAPTEITFNAVLTSIFNVNGEVNNLTVVAGSTVRSRITEFTRTDNNASEAVYQIHQSAESKKVTLAVNVFDSDFGFVRIVNGNPACMPSATTAYLVNPNYVELKTLLPVGSRELENQGGGRRGIIDTILTLAVSDPRAHGKISY
jgi:hypothetical protein